MRILGTLIEFPSWVIGKSPLMSEWFEVGEIDGVGHG